MWQLKMQVDSRAFVHLGTQTIVHSSLLSPKTMGQLKGSTIRFLWAQLLDIFETPVTVTPQQKISKTLNFQKFLENTRRLLLGNERLLLGNERLLLGNERLLLGIIGVFGFFWIFVLLLGGFGSPWVGGPHRGFRKDLTQIPPIRNSP